MNAELSTMNIDVFQPLTLNTALLTDLSLTEFPTEVFGFNASKLDLQHPAVATHYGIVTQGTAKLKDERGSHSLSEGMFFVCAGNCVVDGSNGVGMVITRLNYKGLWQLGGPIELQGRLKYIDGCTDTLLVSPPRLGEPCLNHLHIPPNTNQSPHTHPSERVGVILKGYGECRTSGGTYPLEPGMGWRIPTGLLHSFYTTDSSVDVIAWHPDSDFGPTDENHPMKNRTILK